MRKGTEGAGPLGHQPLSPDPATGHQVGGRKEILMRILHNIITQNYALSAAPKLEGSYKSRGHKKSWSKFIDMQKAPVTTGPQSWKLKARCRLHQNPSCQFSTAAKTGPENWRQKQNCIHCIVYSVNNLTTGDGSWWRWPEKNVTGSFIQNTINIVLILKLCQSFDML